MDIAIQRPPMCVLWADGPYPIYAIDHHSWFDPWLPDGYSRIFRSYVFGPSGFWTMAPLHCAAIIDPFLSLNCARVEGGGIKFCHLSTMILPAADDRPGALFCATIMLGLWSTFLSKDGRKIGPHDAWARVQAASGRGGKLRQHNTCRPHFEHHSRRLLPPRPPF